MYTALSNTCCLYVFISKYPKTIDERSNYLVFFTGLGVEGAALSNISRSDDKINLGTKTYTRFLPDEGVLGLVLAFLGESLVGLEERIVCHKSARQKVTIPWNKGIIQFRIIVFDCSFLATVHTKR